MKIRTFRAAVLATLASFALTTAPVRAVEASALGSAQEILARTDPAHRQKIEQMLPRMQASEVGPLVEALRDFDRYSTYGRTLGTASGFLAVIGVPVGVLAWANTIRFSRGFFNTASRLGALKLWAFGAAGGAAFVFGGMYLLHRMHLRPEAAAKLHQVLDQIQESSGGGTVAGGTGAGPDTQVALGDRPGLQLLGGSMATR